MDLSRFLDAIRRTAPALHEAGMVFAADSAAHAHLAASTGALPERRLPYCGLSPRRLQAISAAGQAGRFPGVEQVQDPVADVLRTQLPLFTTTVEWADGTILHVLTREAVLAELLERGGLAIGLAGLLVRLASTPAIDPDDVRELLKAARRPERFQPLLELLDVA